MKKYQKGRKLGRSLDQRRALLKGLAANLIIKEKITTSQAKAKELRPFVERLITRAKKNDLAAVRYLARYLPSPARRKLLTEVAPRYQERKGGYTRIVKLGQRRTDGAAMALIELVK